MPRLRLRLPLLVAVTGLLVAAPVAAADCPGADLQPSSADPGAVRAAVVCLTNAERADAGLGALASEGRLENAAQGYAQRLVTEQFFDHVAPDGSSLTGRLLAYTGWLALGENLGWGEDLLATPRSIVATWMRSPGHRANVLSGLYTEIGIGVVPGAPQGTSRPAATYVAEYGTRLGVRPSDPLAGVEGGTRVTLAAASPRRPAAARRRLRRCTRGTVRRSALVSGRRVVRCVAKPRRA